MSDKLVFDLAQEVEGSPNVFIRKDWLNILDNQNQNYSSNQSVVDTSQLSNSNKYMSYREAYFSMPFLITLGATNFSAETSGITSIQASASFRPATAGTSCDYSLGLKNWFGQIIHSFTLDYNGTTIIQQTPFSNIWNTFKLMTSLSLDDINTQGATIGFYPDNASTWGFTKSTITNSLSGQGVCNNSCSAVTLGPLVLNSAFNKFSSGQGNLGFVRRQQLINFDVNGDVATTTSGAIPPATISPITDFVTASNLNLLWKSYISNKFDSSDLGTRAGRGVIQYAVVGTIYLKHVHSFFNMCPLLKGVFMKMTLNLNNTSSTIRCTGSTTSTALTPLAMHCTSVSNAVGGVNPLMIASSRSDDGSANIGAKASGIGFTAEREPYVDYIMNISVGAVCLSNELVNANANISTSPLSKSVYLYVPAYTFNPVFEQAYLSSPVKQIKYTDIYQYPINNVGGGGTGMINNLLTNGIANVKSVLVLPFFSNKPSETDTVRNIINNRNTGFLNGVPVYQSPFDPAGCGPTSPMCYLTNFNIQVSGQNAIYNLEKYNFEQFNNQLYGQNAVNGGLTDGITSGLIDRQMFDQEYCYYYVNIERMLPVEQNVPKSIQVLGTNASQKALDLLCFVEYGVEVAIDVMTGARV